MNFSCHIQNNFKITFVVHKLITMTSISDLWIFTVVAVSIFLNVVRVHNHLDEDYRIIFSKKGEIEKKE
jgi:hypothetical protein